MSGYYYIHPYEIEDHIKHDKSSGSQIYFECVDCDGAATYNLDEQVGY